MASFPNNCYCPRPCNKVTQSNIKNFRLHLRRTVYLYLIFSRLAFFTLLLWISRKNRTRLKKIFSLSHRPKWNTSSKIYKLHLIFSLTLALRDQSKWRANINEHGEGYNTHPNFCSKSNK